MTRLSSRAARLLARVRTGVISEPHGDDAKAHWLTEPPTNCPNAPRIHGAAQPAHWRNVLEFGANTGGNLTYILDRHPEAHAVGIDINPIVTQPQAVYPNYRGIVGDEKLLETLPADGFDLAFTVSVLDHIPGADVVERILARLTELSTTVVLLEPVIPGVHGDVSGRRHDEVASNPERPHKRFAPHSYVWDYPRWLSRLPVSWSSRPEPLHAASLGPFYHLFVITRR